MRSFAEIAGKWRHERLTVDISSAVNKLILKADPTRWLVAFWTDIATIRVAPFPIDASLNADGYFVQSGGSALQFKYADYGAVVGYDWYANIQVPGTFLYVHTVCYRG